MDIQIEEALPSVVQALFQVRTSVKENTMALAELREKGITEASVKAMIMSSRCAWVATENGKVVGFSIINREEAILFASFVLPAYEGMSIGKKRVMAAEREPILRHAIIWLETGKKTHAAGFYLSLGWTNETDIGGGDIRLEKHRAVITNRIELKILNEDRVIETMC